MINYKEQPPQQKNNERNNGEILKYLVGTTKLVEPGLTLTVYKSPFKDKCVIHNGVSDPCSCEHLVNDKNIYRKKRNPKVCVCACVCHRDDFFQLFN